MIYLLLSLFLIHNSLEMEVCSVEQQATTQLVRNQKAGTGRRAHRASSRRGGRGDGGGSERRSRSCSGPAIPRGSRPHRSSPPRAFVMHRRGGEQGARRAMSRRGGRTWRPLCRPAVAAGKRLPERESFCLILDSQVPKLPSGSSGPL
jgi:hypothetical protein